MGVPTDGSSIAKPGASGECYRGSANGQGRLTLHEKLGHRESLKQIIVERFSELEDGGERQVHIRRSRSSHRGETLKEW